ncbi:hypothetical protein M0D69_38750 [Caballeronia sp. SEWSISQ10-4 2]|uniref:hypothetical protein n=1 Tax=Caballeronia sp. SEWSISQ10-4 2 TaxID=2937438 RepID=UPI00264BD0F9|nr:hypothetical protein [Caballeronia sp. SEWSISQ10-4 2]MDN7183855.1 hypothetical protein [Caballeronia sp. SEWSISQ10-4 2]
MSDVRLVSLSNVVCQVGIAMPGATAALAATDDGVAPAVAEWERRRDFLMSALADLPVIRPHGGWSMLIDTSELGLEPPEASKLLLERGYADDELGTRCGPLSAFRFLQRIRFAAA